MKTSPQDFVADPRKPEAWVAGARRATIESESELLILADGTIFAHNLTPEMAALLCEMNPGDAAMRRRAEASRTTVVKADL